MNAACRVRLATAADIDAWAAMRASLWPEAGAADHAAELRDTVVIDPRLAGFLAFDAGGGLLGFAEASVRSDYVNGTDGSPVGFLEGWYVDAPHRGRGVGRALVVAVEQWTRAQGCGELASDALLDNLDSHRIHAACGFEETERVVYFRKRLD